MLRLLEESNDEDPVSAEKGYSFRVVQKGSNTYDVSSSVGTPLGPLPDDAGIQIDGLNEGELGALFQFVAEFAARNTGQVRQLTHDRLYQVLTGYNRKLRRNGEIGVIKRS